MEFRAMADYDLTEDDTAEISEQLKLLGIRKLKVPPLSADRRVVLSPSPLTGAPSWNS